MPYLFDNTWYVPRRHSISLTPTPYIFVLPQFLSDLSSFQFQFQFHPITNYSLITTPSPKGFRQAIIFPKLYFHFSHVYQSTFPLFFFCCLLILHWFKHACHCKIVFFFSFLYVWLNGSAMDLCIGICINSFCNIVGW